MALGGALGAAFCLPETSHVRFDLFYQAAGRRTRRMMALVAALVIIAGFAAALPATWDYITFYKIKKSAILKWRLDYVFGIYALFAAAIIGRYIWRAARIVRGQAPGEDDTDNSAEILANGEGGCDPCIHRLPGRAACTGCPRGSHCPVHDRFLDRLCGDARTGSGFACRAAHSGHL
ncbi:TRAP transporter small permease subunit [Pannonibacter sp. Pt2-lr]